MDMRFLLPFLAGLLAPSLFAANLSFLAPTNDVLPTNLNKLYVTSSVARATATAGTNTPRATLTTHGDFIVRSPMDGSQMYWSTSNARLEILNGSLSGGSGVAVYNNSSFMSTNFLTALGVGLGAGTNDFQLINSSTRWLILGGAGDAGGHLVPNNPAGGPHYNIGDPNRYVSNYYGLWMTISNRVGIGTNAPSEVLEGLGGFKFRSPDTASSAFYDHTNSRFHILTHSSKTGYIEVAELDNAFIRNRMGIDSIGPSTPHPLHLWANGASRWVVGTDGTFRPEDHNASIIGSSVSPLSLVATGLFANLGMPALPITNIYSETNIINKNVGIGTNAPAAALHVNGPILFDGILEPVGLVVGAGQSQAIRLSNRVALATAATNAQSANRLLRLPVGIIEIEFDSANTGIVVTNLICSGMGQSQTVLAFGPESPAFAYYGFDVAAGGKLSLSDITLIGPTNTAAASTVGVHYNGYALNVTNSFGYTRLERVTIATNFSRAFQSDAGSSVTNYGGSVLHEFVDCDLSADSQCVAVFTGNGINKKLHASGTYFRKAGTTDQHHLIYVHPPVDLAIANCRFGQTATSGYGIHQYDSGSLTRANNYNYVENSVFENGVSQGILNQAPMRIEGCEFRCSKDAIAAANTNWVTGCLFYSTNASTYMYGTFGTSPIETTMRSCAFFGPLGMGCGVGATNDVTWRISGTTFQGNGPSLLLSSDAVTAHVSDCDFAMSERGIDCTASDLYLRDSVFRGDATVFFGAVRLQGSVTNRVSIDNCRFLSTTRGILSASGWAGRLYGSGNDFGLTDLAQSSDVRQYIQAREGIFTNTVASAANMSVNMSYNTFHVTGTTTINNIYVGNSSAVNFFGGTKLHLIADGQWALSASGNIRPATTTTRTTNTTATLTYDSVAGIWYESSSSGVPGNFSVTGTISAKTNIATMSLKTNFVVINTKYTNDATLLGSRRSLVWVNVAVTNTTPVSVLVDQDADGTYEENYNTVYCDSVGLTNIVHLSDTLQPGAFFVVTNAGPGVMAVFSSKLTGL